MHASFDDIDDSFPVNRRASRRSMGSNDNYGNHINQNFNFAVSRRASAATTAAGAAGVGTVSPATMVSGISSYVDPVHE